MLDAVAAAVETGAVAVAPLLDAEAGAVVPGPGREAGVPLLNSGVEETDPGTRAEDSGMGPASASGLVTAAETTGALIDRVAAVAS